MNYIRTVFCKLVDCVDTNKCKADPIVAGLLAFVPILQHYKGLVFNSALTLVILLIPYFLLRLVPKLHTFRLPQLNIVWVMIAYLVYRVIDHGTSLTELGQSGVLIIYMVILSFGCIDLIAFCRTATRVALIASVLLVLQYICFYLFKFHVQLVPTSLLLSSAEQWILGAQTGLAGITGKINDFYRPSAFFLEPSHFYIYTFPLLLLTLFLGKNKRALYASILLTLGLILCTSGMGIGVAAGAWFLYFALRNEKDGSFSVKNIIRKRNLIMLAILAAFFAMAVIFVPTVRRTVTRIFTTGTGVTAITGRISHALRGLKNLTPLQWVFGVEDTTHSISYNMPGLVAALYRHGLIGAFLSIDIYARSIVKQKLPFNMIAVVILVTSMFSAHTHSTVGILYYTLVLMYGYKIMPYLTGNSATSLK